jgi:hypothetical protein
MRSGCLLADFGITKSNRWSKPLMPVNFHLGRVADTAIVEPGNHVFKKQALNNRLRKVKQVIDGENSLNEIVLSSRKVIRRSLYFKGFADLSERRSRSVSFSRGLVAFPY